MSRRQRAEQSGEQSVSHRTGAHNSAPQRALAEAVPQLSLSEALAAIEQQVPNLTATGCLEVLAAAARLSAVLSARMVFLAAQEGQGSPGPADPSPDLLDAKAAARRLGLSLPTIYRLARSGTLPTVRIGDVLRFDPRELERVVRSSRAIPSEARRM
jgi:excisionase family DNA binding protein